MPLMQIIYSVLLFILLMIPLPALAEDTEPAQPEIFSLLAEEQMVVTPSRHLQPISQSPSTITVITADEIHSSGAANIPDLLRSVPGIEVMETTSADFNVSIRGNNQLLANKLLVLIDGRTVYEEIENSVTWTALPISLEEIDRIEILRGPGSSIWGSNAFDGVVNIITKSPQDLKGTHYYRAAGRLETDIESVVHAGEIGKVDYKIALGYHQANEWRDQEALALKAYRGNLFLSYPLSQNEKISLSGGTAQAPRYDGPLLEDSIVDNNIRYDYVQFNYDHDQSFFRFYWNGFFNDAKYLIFNPPMTLGPYSARSNLYNFEGQHLIQWSQKHLLVGGFSYRLGDIDGSFFGQRHVTQMVGLYLQDQWELIDSLKLTLGERVDYHDVVNDTWSPRVSLIYQFSIYHQVLRASYGTAYRAPTAVELYESGGNPDLKPEKIESYEVAYSAQYWRRSRSNLSLFYNKLVELIDVQSNSVNINRDRVNIYGMEISQDVPLTSWLSMFVNYSYQHLEALNGNDTIADFRRTAPGQKINAGITTQWENGLNTRLLIHHVSKIEYLPDLVTNTGLSNVTPTYTVVNLWVGYHFEKEKIETALSVYNLFNDVHREYPLGDEIGRRVMAHLTLNF
jgi:iron complex outermembrane receptor protein